MFPLIVETTVFEHYSAGGNYDSRFDVGKASGTLIVARPLDAEQKSNYNLTVEATDGTRTVSTQVIETLMKCLKADEALSRFGFSSSQKDDEEMEV